MPLPATTLVIVPLDPVIGSQRDTTLFQPKYCKFVGAAAATSRVCSLKALTLVTRLPSTAGICAPAVNCKILLEVVPTSIARVPLPVMVFGTCPVPATTLNTVPVDPVMGSQRETTVFQ